jgi:hypothetical protein
MDYRREIRECTKRAHGGPQQEFFTDVSREQLIDIIADCQGTRTAH